MGKTGWKIGDGQQFLLDDISWQFYEAFLHEIGDRHTCLSYLRGQLELTTSSHLHERYRVLVRRLIHTLTYRLLLPIGSYGSMTVRRQDLQCGLEPDECFYLTNEPVVRVKRSLDFLRDPPPDLSLDITLSPRGVDRKAIYALLGVPEYWQFDGNELRVFQLGDGSEYVRVEHSHCFPFFDLSAVPRFVRMSMSEGENAANRAFADWIARQYESHLQS